jgi:uncharacterized repeat protein (TIGR01451 family)
MNWLCTPRLAGRGRRLRPAGWPGIHLRRLLIGLWLALGAAASARAAPGTISATLSPNGPIGVGDQVTVTMRLSNYTDTVEIDGFSFVVSYDSNRLSFVSGSFNLGTASGPDQQWLSKPNQDPGYSLMSSNSGATPGAVTINMGDGGTFVPQRGTIATFGFLVAFRLQATAAGTTTIMPQAPANGVVLIRTNRTPAGVPAFTGASLVVTNPAPQLDFGDAPPPYRTLLANDGARHRLVSGLRLGALVDPENDGLPNATATGDDLAGTNDEDGVTFTTPLIPSLSATVQVVASLSGRLDAWIDFDADGDWMSASEQIFNNRLVSAGTNTLSFPVPPTARPTNSTFARFRLSTGGGLDFRGEAPDGEVEDYQVAILGIADLVLAKSDFPDPVGVGSNLTYTLRITNFGPALATSVTVTDTLPAGVVFVMAGSSQGTCTNEGGSVRCALGPLAPGSNAVVGITVTAPNLGTITNSATVASVEPDLNPANNASAVTTLVRDLTPPVITCPANIVTGADSAQCSRSNVTFTATATDNHDTNVTVTCSPPSGSTFPVGVTTVTCTATDAAGNSSGCSFTVTVNDTEPPVIACSHEPRLQHRSGPVQQEQCHVQRQRERQLRRHGRVCANQRRDFPQGNHGRHLHGDGRGRQLERLHVHRDRERHGAAHD